nr:hypothetical protein HmN_000232300 [Hymenolepis microstoma]
MWSDFDLLVNCWWKGKRERDFSIVLLLGMKNGCIVITLTLTQTQKIMGIARWSYCYVNTSAEYPWLKSHALRLQPSQASVIERSPDESEPCSRKKKNSHSTTRNTIRWLFYSMIMLDLTRWTSGEKYLETLKWEILSHPPPYSPDVAPSADFHLTHLAQ